jgi:hypothetical protein
LHIVPAIGAVKLTTLTQERIEGFRDELLKKLSRPLARKVLTSLNRYSRCPAILTLLLVSRLKEVATKNAGSRPAATSPPLPR